MNSKKSVFLVVTVVIVLSVWFGIRWSSVSMAAGDPVALYKTHCKTCHGESGKPTELGIGLDARDLTDANWQAKVTDEKIIKQIEDGTPEKMMPFKTKLSKEEINSLVSVVRSFVKK